MNNAEKFNWKDGDVQIHGTGTQGSEPNDTPEDFRGSAEMRQVWHGTRELDPARSQKIVNHSPDGFNWGYGGSGPSQLALAILLEYLDDDQADRHHQDFKWALISKLPQGADFRLEERTVLDWIIDNVKETE